MRGYRGLVGCIIFSVCVSRVSVHAQPDSTRTFSIHGQVTVVSQFHPPFRARYSGARSLSSGTDARTSVTSTLFLGWSPLRGTEVYVNPELSAGSGLSGTVGIAAFPNGEIYRVENPRPTVSIARLFLRQTIGLGADREFLGDDQNQIAVETPSRRFVLTVGKFSILDMFDDNSWSHDPRRDFLNWALMANGAWDYPADTRGYTLGVALEYVSPAWAARIARVAVPLEANGMVFDRDWKNAYGLAAEVELHEGMTQIPGIIRAVYYRNRARLGSYREALEQNPVDLTSVGRPGGVKWGLGLNYEVDLSQSLGLFARAGWNDGAYETWAFTDIDRTVSVGIVARGNLWGRPEDRVGIASLANGISADHREYLKAGGYSFIIGDGALAYGTEALVEGLYSCSISRPVTLTADYQLVLNPAYNRDRGPVNIFALRIHLEL